MNIASDRTYDDLMKSTHSVFLEIRPGNAKCEDAVQLMLDCCSVFDVLEDQGINHIGRYVPVSIDLGAKRDHQSATTSCAAIVVPVVIDEISRYMQELVNGEDVSFPHYTEDELSATLTKKRDRNQLLKNYQAIVDNTKIAISRLNEDEKEDRIIQVFSSPEADCKETLVVRQECILPLLEIIYKMANHLRRHPDMYDDIRSSFECH